MCVTQPPATASSPPRPHPHSRARKLPNLPGLGAREPQALLSCKALPSQGPPLHKALPLQDPPPSTRPSFTKAPPLLRPPPSQRPPLPQTHPFTRPSPQRALPHRAHPQVLRSNPLGTGTVSRPGIRGQLRLGGAINAFLCLLPPHPSLSACHGLLTGRYLSRCSLQAHGRELTAFQGSIRGTCGTQPRKEGQGWAWRLSSDHQGLGRQQLPEARSGQSPLGRTPCCQAYFSY